MSKVISSLSEEVKTFRKGDDMGPFGRGQRGGKKGGCNNFSKGCFLSCMGREVWLFSKVWELAFLLYSPPFFQRTHTTPVIG